MSINGEPYDNIFAALNMSLFTTCATKPCLKRKLIYSFDNIDSVQPQSALNWLSPLAYEHMLSVYAAKVD